MTLDEVLTLQQACRSALQRLHTGEHSSNALHKVEFSSILLLVKESLYGMEFLGFKGYSEPPLVPPLQWLADLWELHPAEGRYHARCRVETARLLLQQAVQELDELVDKVS